MKQTLQVVSADPLAPFGHAMAQTTTAATALQPSPRAARLPAADILRGLAITWVFLFHASEGRHLDGLIRMLPETLVSIVFSAGHLGVAVFFVLSGLVIAMSGERCGDSLAAAGNFVARRLVRLAPPYYLSLLITLGFLLLKRTVESTVTILPEPGAFVAHLLFLQNLLGLREINSVYWTLCIEIQFYFVFCALMLLVRRLGRGRLAGHGWLAVMGVACAVAALWPLGLARDDATWHASFLPTWHLFLLGVLLHHACKRTQFAAAPYLAYLVVLTVVGILDKNAFTLAGVVTSIVLYGLARWPREDASNRFRLLTNLGLVSYSFYLLHNPVTGAAFNVTRRLAGNGVAAELAGLVFSFALCVIAAAISYAVIERPSMRWGRRLRTTGDR